LAGEHPTTPEQHEVNFMFRFAKYFLFALVILAPLAMPSPAPAQVSVGIGIHIGPPALPVYVQPVCPAVGYIWTPGYWAYGDDGYFWVPGTWVLAPTPGYLWTPGYWGWGGGAYLFHAGYWGPHVGFYGGINYGFGYGGVGFVGGEWRGGVYHYNTAVTNVNTTVIHNTYRTTVINNTTVNRVSFNGGTGGTVARPNSSELAAAREHHVAATSLQEQHLQAARGNRTLLASENHGHPAVAATARPGVFSGKEVVAAHGAGNTTNRPTNTASTNGANTHLDRPPNSHTTGTSATPKSNTTTNTNRPNTVHSNTTNTNRPPTNTNTTHPNTAQPVHSSTSKPPQQHTNSKAPSEPHHEGSHPGGVRGR
jgi:WXXGXW repeat (2 copies)